MSTAHDLRSPNTILINHRALVYVSGGVRQTGSRRWLIGHRLADCPWNETQGIWMDCNDAAYVARPCLDCFAATVPKVGSRWVWEIEDVNARVLIEVSQVEFNGDEWWVVAKDMTNPFAVHKSPLGRFWEAVTPVGASKDELSEKGES